ncbi:MAG: tetratricopeptide repeat protein [Balneolaceae bacterium]|nr:tetratricopeptide repeat protein [Balneolaceae bacterium]
MTQTLAAITDVKRRKMYDEAEKYYREALDIRLQLVGEEHPDVAYSLVHLGNLLRAKGEYEEAEKLLLEALEMRKKTHMRRDNHIIGLEIFIEANRS